MRRLPVLTAPLLAALLTSPTLWAQGGAAGRKKATARERQQDVPERAPEVEHIDRVVVRWHSRATGGVAKPQFITARQLALEARIEALMGGDKLDAPYNDKHVRSAMQRHITETMLARLPVDPEPSPKQVDTYAEAAREMLLQRIGAHATGLNERDRRKLGMAKLRKARAAEKATADELMAILRRRARASWYLDKMIAPMLAPSELDLREVHKRGETPFSNQRFEDVKKKLSQWYISTRLAEALDRYFRNARSRVKVIVIARPKR